MDKNTEKSLLRWRMILGKYSESSLSFPMKGGSKKFFDIDEALDFLYNREYSGGRGVRDADLSPSCLTVPEWISKIRELFPEETVEILQHDALDRYELKEIITDKEVLEKIEPDMDLLKSILNFKNIMPSDVLDTARAIIRKVVEELIEKMKEDIYQAFTGTIDRTKRSHFKVYKNIDWKRTIRENLDNYDSVNRKMFLENLYFFGRVKKRNTWHVILLVDESGSMLDSVIYSAVIAGIFSKLPSLKTSLAIFDTKVVDLSEYIDDPVEILMSVQLGGGTDIGQALRYGEGLVEYPNRTIIILVTDFHEGAPEEILMGTVCRLVESGVKLLGLAALDDKAHPDYNRHVAEKISALGGHIAALTPKGLAQWVAGIVNS